MKVLFVVQRYGHEVAGGAERACREFATRLAARGHDVHALTSRAVSYVDWADSYPAGDSVLDGVTVHRLSVVRPRADRVFGPLNARVPWAGGARPRHLERAWVEQQGPLLAGYDTWLRRRAAEFDAVVFFTYLYHPTWRGLPLAAARTATMVHATAHDEPPFWLPLFDQPLRAADLLTCLTPEEESLLRTRGIEGPAEVIGVGVDLPESTAPAPHLLTEFGIDDRPYFVFVGRLDPGKGSDELWDYWVQRQRLRPSDAALVVVGEPVKPLPPHPDVIVTGFVPDAVRDAAISGARAMIVPSYFESFSMVLTESWAHRRPALVQGRCDVLAGQVRRSGGGFAYDGFAEFDAAVDLLLERPDVADALGRAGRSYCEQHYAWDVIMTRYEAHLERLAELGAERIARPA